MDPRSNTSIACIRRWILHTTILHSVSSITARSLLLHCNNLLVFLDQSTPAAAKGLEAVGRAVSFDSVLGTSVTTAAEDEEAFESEGHEESIDGALIGMSVSRVS